MKVFYSITAFFLHLSLLTGQYDHIHIESDLSGNALLDVLADDYKTNNVMSYGDARDTLYKIVYLENGQVSGIYSGHSIALPDDVSPRTFLFMNGADYGINAEHSYPQSKGAGEGNPRSDMHHLFPSAVLVNGERGSNPFAEIADNQTDRWYFEDDILNFIPINNIDSYSESTETRFEPRESVKGNIARAIMYFYTMYKDQADNADPDFFWSQIDQLCEWHYADPVDSLEWLRTFRIAKYQDDFANPFILDCSLAGRTYCDEVADVCQEFINTDVIDLDASTISFDIIPNPANNRIAIHLIDNDHAQANLIIRDMLGQELLIHTLHDRSEEVNISLLPPGNYIVTLLIDHKIASRLLSVE